MIIGLTGDYGSGKDTVAKFLKNMNFYLIPLSDFLREELKGKKVTKEKLIEAGNELRLTYGPDVLAKKAIKRLMDGENHVLTSIRNPAEVKLLQQRDDFLLVNITAPEKVRLKRYIQRGEDSDPKTIDELRAIEQIENSSNENKQQLANVAKMAKVTILNDSTEKKLRSKVEKLVSDWLYKLQDYRPNWDHYFMGIAEAVKVRCNCMSAKKGAIIVKEKQIISTGYNGSAKGIKHCNVGSCRRCKLRHLGKIKSGEYNQAVCTCAHAEENAIVQAAHNGTSTKGAIIYTTFTPCHVCARMIINAGIKEVIAKVVYPDDVGTRLFKEAGVKLRVLK
jgi:dCMP deaminase